ncbi:MAG TPA: HPP family protein [Tepidisphaeraceae bacterium]|jgi:CBS-domain-containing membrane protein|nr:HPP family protein [Tepidisphaeraceae bacterium]
MSVSDELLLAILPTVTVLVMIALIESFGRHHLLCASLASSAFLIYLDPEHQANAVRTLILSQMTAAGVGWTMWTLLGTGYAATGSSMALAILLMILLDAVHPPAVSTALAFAMHADQSSSVTLFGLAVGITAVLVLLQRVVVWLLARRAGVKAQSHRQPPAV